MIEIDIRILVIGLAVAIVILSLGGCAYSPPPNEVINYRTYTDPDRGIFYIVDSVLDRAELISGPNGANGKVIITRQGN